MPYSAFLRLVVRSFFSGLFFVLVSGCSDTDVDSPAPAPVFSVAEQTLYRVTSSEQILSIVLVSDAAHTVEVTEGDDWLLPAYMNTVPGESRFVVLSNGTSSDRRGSVVFRSSDGTGSETVSVVQSGSTDRDPERTALRALYASSGGDGWFRNTNWCGDSPLGSWYGVTTDSDGHVVELRLPDNNLCGCLPHEISLLTHLRVLDLSRNSLESDLVYELPLEYTEVLRSDFDPLTSLEELDLSHNRFYTSSHHLPSFTGMNSLRRVDLSFNDMQCLITSPSWQPLFENGRYVDLIFHHNRMLGEVEDFLQNHPEWGRLGLQMLRQWNRNGTLEYDRPIVVPDFTFTDLRTGAQGRMRDVYSSNKLTMLLSWDPTDEGSCRFTERSVSSYRTLYGGQGFAVVAMIPEGDEYRRAAEAYLSTHDVDWPVVSDYADGKGRRIDFPREPYPSYLLFDGEGRFLEEVYTGIPCSGNIYSDEPKELDLVEREFQYANYMNEYCQRVFGDCTYESRDYSMDRQSEVLQRATRGKGIDLVLMGDAFTDIDIETGFYKEVMELAMKSLFASEPMKSYRDYFTVHMVYAVSKKRQLSETRSDCALRTTATGKYGAEGYTNAPYQYASRLGLVSKNRFISIIVNGSGVGLTYLEQPSETYAYTGFPPGGGVRFPGVVQHESVGHGLGLLGDEYVQEENPDMIPESEKERLRACHDWGIYWNVSETNDPAAVAWSHLIGHPRYPRVGMYEGGYYHNRGVWHSEPGGIMVRSNSGYFSTFCRELIVRRIMELSGEEYTFEKFLERDVPPASQSSLRAPCVEQEPGYHHIPPIIDGGKP